MKNLFISVFLAGIFMTTPVFAAAKPSVKPSSWKPLAPPGYTPITWAQAPGIASFFKAPEGSGSIDFLTRIYLPQNQIQPVLSGAPSDNGPADSQFVPDRPAEVIDAAPADQDILANLSFQRVVAETAKAGSPVKFLWDAPFFNLGAVMSDLSLAFKYAADGKETVTSGTRSDADLSQSRNMLLIDNRTGRAAITVFDNLGFLDKAHDLALEGFAPTIGKSDGNAATGRLFLGVSDDGKELLVYCSQQATVKEASEALAAAGAAPKNQLQADGGGSAACGYNLPGQFFVEPSRTLPLLMGAATVVARGTITTEGTNIRKGPATKNAIVTKLVKGTAVRAYEERSGWYRIGENQWVNKTLVKTIDIGK